MVYYSFTAMTYEQPLIRSAGKNTQLVAMLGFGSFAVVVILLFFMANTNRFLLKIVERTLVSFIYMVSIIIKFVFGSS